MASCLGVRYFSVADLFAVGIAVDLAGAYHLARGLLTTPEMIALRGGSFLGGNPSVVMGLVEDRVDGRFGVRVLLGGFALQAAGYVLDLALAPSSPHSTLRAALAVVLAIAAGVAVLIAWRAARRRLVAGGLIAVASVHIENAQERPRRRTQPDVSLLAGYGRVWLDNGRLGETDAEYVRRVFPSAAS